MDWPDHFERRPGDIVAHLGNRLLNDVHSSRRQQSKVQRIDS